MAGDEAHIEVRITPRGRRDAITGWRDGVLLVRVSAPPVEGRANAALLRLLASALRLPPSSLRLVAGAQGRRKIVGVSGLEKGEALRRLSRAATGPSGDAGASGQKKSRG